MNVIKKWLQTQPSFAAAIRPSGGGAQPLIKKRAGAPGPQRGVFLPPILRHSLMAGLLCIVVVLTYALLGMIAYHLYYHFWLLVFLVLFTPVWLVCYGLLFSSRWKWHELVLGVFAAMFLMSHFYLNSVEDMSYRLLSSLLTALGGVLAVSLGFWLAKLSLSLFKTQKRPGS